MTSPFGMNPSVIENYHIIRENIRTAAIRSGRTLDDVRLVAVSKTVEEVMIRQLHDIGHLEFGESRLQEASSKMCNLPPSVIWHFIGRLQKNKVRRIISDFAFIHSVDSLKIAQYIDFLAGGARLRPKILLQVNLAEEETKGGFSIEEIQTSIGQLLSLDHLKIIGLMCLPPFAEEVEESRLFFRRLRELRDEMEKSHGCSLPHLSMGMSHDYSVAIEEGATFVRVGSSLFGNRVYSAHTKNPIT